MPKAITLSDFCSSSSQDYYIQQERKFRQAADSGLRDNKKKVSGNQPTKKQQADAPNLVGV
jgi:hypothetical protein